MKLLTLLIPAFNEEGSLLTLRSRLLPVLETLKGMSVETELIILDNCSTDKTRQIAKQFCEEDARWKYVRYSRNFGYHGSLACGFDVASGDALIVLASDLQEPPELIPVMVENWLQGYDVVYGVLNNRNDQNWFKTLGAQLFYRIFSILSDTDITPFATDFRIVSRRVIDVVNQMREADRYLRGMVHWAGFKQKAFHYDRETRKEGKSSADTMFLFAWAFNAIFCFSKKPLRLMSVFGLLTVLLVCLLSLFFLINYFFKPAYALIPPTGTTALALLILFGIGINAFFMGIIGEYLGRVFNQVKLRPLYVIDESSNINIRYNLGYSLVAKNFTEKPAPE